LSPSVADTDDNDENDNSCDGSTNCTSDSSSIIGVVAPAGSVVGVIVVGRIVFWAKAIVITATHGAACAVASNHVFIIIKID